MTRQNEITLNSIVIACSLEAVALLLISISVAGHFIKYIFHYNIDRHLRLFDLSLELNIPTFYSMLLLFFISLLLGIITILQSRQKNSDVTKWTILSIGFLYMAYDEGFQVHEDLVAVIRPLLGDGNLGIFYYAWVIPAMALVFVLALFFSKFLLRLPSVTRTTFLIAATCYLSGCIGFELVGGYYDELHGGFNSLTYNLISTIEESLEMTGLIIFIYALLEYLAANNENVTFRVQPFKRKAEAASNNK